MFSSNQKRRLVHSFLGDGAFTGLPAFSSQLFGYGLVLGQIAVMLPEHHPAENQAPTRHQG